MKPTEIYALINELKEEVCELRKHFDAEADKHVNQEPADSSDVLRTMKEVKSEVNELRQQIKTGRNQWRPKYGCQICKREGTASLCRHCFKCGSESHKIADCPSRNSSNTSNTRRPLTNRDSQ